MAEPKGGTLVAVGGAEDKLGSMLVLRRLLAEVDRPARIELIPTASAEPLETAQPYLDAFRALGAANVDILDIRDRQAAAHPAHVARVRHADIVYMTGGDQARLSAILGGTPVLAAMRAKLASGGVVAGTSAGAAAMSGTMIAQGSGTLRRGSVHLTLGLNFLPGAVLDTHFAERGRFGRLIEVIGARPGLLGVGLGENTAIVLRDGEAEVVGSGSVALVDGGEVRASDAAHVPHDHPVSIDRMIVRTLAHGATFRLDRRRVVPMPTTRRRRREG